MKRYINSGVRLDDGKYQFNYDTIDSDEIVELKVSYLVKSKFNNNTYWFGYVFKPDTSSKDRSDFIAAIKGLEGYQIDINDLLKFIEAPLDALSEEQSLYDIDCLVYPLSGRSNLVKQIVKVINRRLLHDTYRLSFELVKSAPTDIQFDWSSFNAEESDDPYRYSQMKNYVDTILLPAIHKLDYFSLAHSVKPKYRKYIKNYLKLSEEDRQELAGLQGANILVVDDINTSGSTLDEILRVIGEVNQNCNIFIYTLIGH